MNRQEFLLRVRDAAQAGRAYRVHAKDKAAGRVGYCGAGDNHAQHLALEVQAAGGHAWLVPNQAAARERLRLLLQEHAPRSALCWRHAVLDRLGLDDLLAAQATLRVDAVLLADLPQAEQRAAMLSAEIGISSVSWAVAETGTLALGSMRGQERSASLLPPVHVALVEAEQIIPDLFDLFDQLHVAGLDQLPTNLVLITGPSKTGDLELKLTTGVHGPGEWHVIVIAGDREPA